VHRMPYISPQAREHIAQGYVPATAGELNYALTKECQHWHLPWIGTRLSRVIVDYMVDHPIRAYQDINDVLGAMAGARLEFRRREGEVMRVENALEAAQEAFYTTYAVPYEEEKRRINGDVY
jgi:hypothetical protein